MNNRPVISTGNLTSRSLSGRAAVVTGAGSGIGFEAARSLAWLGAEVIIAEIDKKAGAAAATDISKEMGQGKVIFVHTDVGDERSVRKLANEAFRAFGRVDIVLNNAAVEPVGAVKDAPVEAWDLSYKVNLRGPVLLARAFLPRMLERNSGVFICVSSVGGAYMGPYEVLKRAQVELAGTISAECEGTGVVSFVIGPGLVPETRGAREQMPRIARMMGKTVEEFIEMSRAALISVEAAGAGFAAAAAMASRFRGQEISSLEALHEAGIELAGDAQPLSAKALTAAEIEEAGVLSRILLSGLEEQRRQWQGLGIFQRQWMTRDFSKRAGMPIEKAVDKAAGLKEHLEAGRVDEAVRLEVPLQRLAEYFAHLQEMTKGYVKDEKLRDEQMLLQQGWKESAEKLALLLGSGSG